MTNTENYPKISTAGLFCLLMLSRLSAEIVYPRSGAGCGGETLLAVITAEVVRLLLALPIIIYSFRKNQIYRAAFEKNRFFGITGALGAALLLLCASAKTIWSLGEFAQRNLISGTSALILGIFAAAFAVYSAFSSVEGLARSGVLFLAGAVIVTLAVIAADIPHMKTSALVISDRSGYGTFFEDVLERITRGGEYLIFAALLPYVRVKKVSAAATVGFFALFSALASMGLSAFYCLVLRELYGLVEYPLIAAAALADVGFFRRLDGGAAAVWSLCAALRAGLMLFSAWAVFRQVFPAHKNNCLKKGGNDDSEKAQGAV